ncbi:MAG TPA: hypothetical protein VFA51_11410, partial [Candidatus Udaeobacter sp.]|nr:hypothetical protein [Candidatus Udaeobacter sp.]
MNRTQLNSKPAPTQSMSRNPVKRFAYICAAATLLLSAIAPLVAAPNASQPASSDMGGMALREAVNVANPEGTPPVPLIEQGAVQVKLATVASGLTAPLELTSANDGTGRLFIVQQTGQIRILRNGAVLPTPFLNVA